MSQPSRVYSTNKSLWVLVTDRTALYCSRTLPCWQLPSLWLGSACLFLPQLWLKGSPRLRPLVSMAKGMSKRTGRNLGCCLNPVLRWGFSHILWPGPKRIVANPKASDRGTQSFTENEHVGSCKRQQMIPHLHFAGGGNEARKGITPFIWASNQAQTENPGGGKRQPRKAAQWLEPSGQNGMQDGKKEKKLCIKKKSASCQTEGGRERQRGKIDIC